jgi:S1-C subfamily serine protease
MASSAGLQDLRKERERKIFGTPQVRTPEQAELAVVKILAKDEREVVQTGSGIFLGITQKIAYILTAYHVVGDDKNPVVEFRELPGRGFTGKFLKGDEDLDVAVIEVRSTPREIAERIIPFETGSAADVIKATSSRIGAVLKESLKNPESAQKEAPQVIVGEVHAGSPAEKAGIRQGDVILKINGRVMQSSSDVLDLVSGTPAGSEIELAVSRQGQMQVIRCRVEKAPSQLVFTIGHPPGKEWSWQAGYILATEKDVFRLTKNLVEFGVSGGPLFDGHYRTVGLVVRKGGASDFALPIDRALAKLAEWRVPYRFWMTNEFCDKLNTIMTNSKSDFADLKKGGSRTRPGDDKLKIWDAEIDLSGRGKSTIEEGGVHRHTYRAEMIVASSDNEAEVYKKEVAASVRKCIPIGSVDTTQWGIIIRVSKSFWGSPIEVEILRFATAVILEVHSP